MGQFPVCDVTAQGQPPVKAKNIQDRLSLTQSA